VKLSIVLSVQPARFEAATFKGTLDVGLARIAELGYNGVELAIRSPTQVDLETLLHKVTLHALEVPAVGTGQAWGEDGLSFIDPNPEIRRTAIERVIAHIPFASRVGAHIIIGLIRGVIRPGQTHEQAMAYVTDALRECCREASAHSVSLAVEPLNRYETTLINTVEQGLELLDHVGENNLGLLLDTFHMNIEEPSIVDSIHRAAGRILHVHVADSNRHPPGSGHLDFPVILRELKEVGYQGYLSGEFMPLPDADTAAAQSIALLRTLRTGVH